LLLECALQETPEGGGRAIFGAHVACNGRQTIHPHENRGRSGGLSYAFCAGYVILQIPNFTLTDDGALGWWSVYQAGFLHRDVSIGNILMVEEPFESKRGFSIEVEELLRDTASESSEAAHSLSSSDPLTKKKGELTERIREDAKNIKELILQNGLSGNRTRAFIMDFDISTSWIGYFNADHSAGSISVCHFV
jgi:hypothetical protein